MRKIPQPSPEPSPGGRTDPPRAPRFDVLAGGAPERPARMPPEARGSDPIGRHSPLAHPLAVRQCEVLQANLWLRYPANMTTVTLFIGATAGCGVSTVVNNFVAALGQDAGARVLLVDFSHAGPAPAPAEGPGPDLLHLLDYGPPPSRSGSAPNVHAIRGASLGPMPLALFQSDAFDQFLQAARNRFDCVVIDAPPLQGHPESLVLSRKADGVVLVIESGATRKQTALWAKQQIEGAGGNLMGVVLNKRRYYIPRWLYGRV